MARQVNMPEKKDSFGQGLQMLQTAKSIYDSANSGKVQPGGGTETASMTSGYNTSSNAMQRRNATYGSTV